MNEVEKKLATEMLVNAVANDSLLIRQLLEQFGRIAAIVNRGERFINEGNPHDKPPPDMEKYPIEVRHHAIVVLAQRYAADEIACSVR